MRLLIYLFPPPAYIVNDERQIFYSSYSSPISLVFGCIRLFPVSRLGGIYITELAAALYRLSLIGARSRRCEQTYDSDFLSHLLMFAAPWPSNESFPDLIVESLKCAVVAVLGWAWELPYNFDSRIFYYYFRDLPSLWVAAPWHLSYVVPRVFQIPCPQLWLPLLQPIISTIAPWLAKYFCLVFSVLTAVSY